MKTNGLKRLIFALTPLCCCFLAYAIQAQVPSIITQPTSLSSAVGGTIKFTVSAAGGGTLAYQWQKNTTNLANGTFSGRATVSGTTTASVTLAGITTNDQANYSCRITNGFGSVTSSIVTLTVDVAPTITTQPVGKTNSPGANISFTVVAAGTAPLSYQWKENGTDIPTATLNVYSLNNVSASDTGTYSVSVSNPAGTVNSSNAPLVVEAPPVIVAPPAGSTNFVGDTYTFNVTATGDDLAYQWKRNGGNIPGATSNSYTLTDIQTAAAGTYSVTISNLSAKVTSAGATLWVVGPLVISVQPASQTAEVGDNVTFGVTASDGSPQLFYQWFESTNLIASATDASLTLNDVQLTNSSSYYVVITNGYTAVTSTVATLSVQYFAPNIITQPLGGNQAVGDNFTFMVTATGTALNYQWQKNGTNIVDATGPSFALSNLGLVDAGNYTVVITNVVGSVTSSIAALTVQYFPPAITVQPVGGSELVGSTFTFNVAATGTALTYQWKQNDTAILSADTPSLTLNNLGLTNAGDYTVVISNTVGSVTSSVATLYVGYAPVIVQQPGSLTNAFGSTASFSSVATGPLPMNFQWFQNGGALNGQTNATFTLTNLQLQDVGSYQMTAANAFGSTSSSVAVLHLSPGILCQPTNQIAMPGSTSTNSFSVLAGGEAPVSYQWLINGTNLSDNGNISGSTSNILSVVGASTNTLGSYSVVVSNTYGSVTSALATLRFGFTPISFFGYSGTPQPYSVPAGVTQLWVSILGASGARGANDCCGGGAAGGVVRAVGVIAISATNQLLFSVGGGATGTNGGISPNPIFNGGNGGTGVYAGGGGGAATSIQMPDGGYIVVGGSGGGGADSAVLGSGGSGTQSMIVGSIGSTAGQNGGANVSAGGGGGGGAIGGLGGSGVLGGYAISGSGGNGGGTFLPTNYLYGSFQWTFTSASTSDGNGSITIVANPIPIVTQQPESQAAIAGSSAQFNIAVSSPVPLSYQWFMNGDAVTNGTNSSLQFSTVTPQNVGTYFVVITNAYASITSSVVTLSVNIPAYITSQPQDQSVLQRGSATFTVVATGTPSLEYQWYQQLDTVATATPILDDGFVLGATVTGGGAGYLSTPNVNISGGGGSGASATATVRNGVVTTIDIVNPGSDYTSLPTISIDPPSAPLNGETNTILSITVATTNDAENYFVVVTNNYGAATSSVVALTVSVPVYIITQPTNLTVSSGGNASFSVTAGGTAPFAYQWYALPATNTTATATALVLNGFVYGAMVSIGGSGYVSIPNVQILGGGSGAFATALVSNGTVIAINIANPGSGYTNPPLILIDPPSAVDLTESTNQVLDISPITTNNVGSYFVIVANNYGSVTSSVASLVITSLPQNFGITVGSNQSVQLKLTGLANFSYVLQSATNLSPPVAWQFVVTNLSDSNGNWTFMDTNTIDYPVKFYRLQTP
jgi:uncharacterized protein YpmS